MPKNKLQGTVFGLIMSYAMAIGMEVYNIAYKMGFHLADGGFSSMTNASIAGMPATQLPAIWVGTVLKNFPMAFFWNMFAAAPFSHWLFQRIFSR